MKTLVIAGFWLVLSTRVMAGDAAQVASLMDEGRMALASQALHEALELNPGDPQLRLLDGVMSARMGRDTEAARVFQDLIREHPQLPEPYNNLAIQRAEAGALEQAADLLNRALVLAPDYVTARANLADVYLQLALRSYRRALRDGADPAQLEPRLAVLAEPEPRPAALPAEPAVEETRDGPVAVAEAVGPVVEQPAAALTVESEPAQRSAEQSPPTTAEALAATVAAWAEAWDERDPERHLAYYDASFQPRDGLSLETWRARRRAAIEAAAYIQVQVDDLEIVQPEDAPPQARFIQQYRSDRYSDRVEKTLSFVRRPEGWRIVREEATLLAP